MKRKVGWAIGIASALLLISDFLIPLKVFAHCDTMEGPVVQAAKKALETRDVNLVLIWVQNKDEAEIKKVFQKTLDVRKLSPEAKSLADIYFFETLVRIHRAGEGAPYNGLKSESEAELGPAVPAADKAIETRDISPVLNLVNSAVDKGIQEHFKEVMGRKNYKKSDVASGRDYVKAYVEYVHYVEGIYAAAQEKGEHLHNTEHPEGHK